MTILSNKAQCLLCGDVIESKHRHDFRYCSCESLAVDGGVDYIRRLYTTTENYKEMSEFDGEEV